MPDFPLLIFPDPDKFDREKPKGFPPKEIHYPPIDRQTQRLTPIFSALQTVFNNRSAELQQSLTGIDPEQVLVFEIVGTVDDFAKSISKIEGMEWLGEYDIDEISPDNDFFQVDNANKELSGRLFLTMTNSRALTEMLSLWETYKEDPSIKFRKGLAKFKDVFKKLRDIRKWGIQDRFIETNILNYWLEGLALNPSIIRFELQLWYSSSSQKRESIDSRISKLIGDLQGQVISKCIIPSISYHALLVELPSEHIQYIIEHKDTDLLKSDEIMFFRPSGQIALDINIQNEEVEQLQNDNIDNFPSGNPVIGLLDGLPMENHQLLTSRLIIDDPDNFSDLYEAQYRVHGTGMGSLIIHGDLNANEPPISTPLYVRPIMKLQPTFNGYNEVVPNNVLFVDLLHRAVKRIFEGDSDFSGYPSIRVLNLSIGDRAAMFYHSMSPVARLLDWLSYKYKVLFIVSAGNHINDLALDELYKDFKLLSNQDKEKLIYKKVIQDNRNRRLLSPSESINNLTIGSVHYDYSTLFVGDRRLNPSLSLLPNVHSAFGLGYRKSIKPDMVYYGGRQFFHEPILDNSPTPLRYICNYSVPGQKVAAPGANLDSTYHARGTSNATALISRHSCFLIEVLKSILGEQYNETAYQKYLSSLIKVMLIHGCSWSDLEVNINSFLAGDYTNPEIKNITTKWLGYGLPDIEKVKECTQQRVTVLGFGELTGDKVHVFKLPLPPSLSSRPDDRKLTISLGWFSPISSSTQKYRVANLYFEAENESIGATRDDVDWRAVKRGTLQHEIFVGNRAIPFEDGENISIKVTCKNDAAKIEEPIPYAIAVTLEVAENVDISIYEEVKDRLIVPVTIEQKI